MMLIEKDLKKHGAWKFRSSWPYTNDDAWKNDGRKMKALYIIGETPIMVDVNMNHTRAAIENVDLVIVQDLFLHETAKIADVVLPARSWAEVE
ncbi:molybdopterin-dependent oxidoreductase [Anaerobacillus sp. HL2]|nr:molybdopterin-dependent oxidoreductase [Anaerobacillus sp. HL2]